MRRIVLAAACLAAAISSPRAADEARPVPTLSVTGRATLEAAPDVAAISVGVSHRAPTAGAAIDLASAAAAKIVATVRAFGIEPRDVQTGRVSLAPAFRTVREPSGAVEQKPDGYTAVNSVTVRIRDLSRLGALLRDVVDGGANQIGGVSFELADPKTVEGEALARAVRDARRQADIMAQAAGVTIRRVETMTVGSVYRAMPRPAAPMRAERAQEDVPVEAGSLEITQEVQMTFSLGQP